MSEMRSKDAGRRLPRVRLPGDPVSQKKANIQDTAHIPVMSQLRNNRQR